MYSTIQYNTPTVLYVTCTVVISNVKLLIRGEAKEANLTLQYAL
jgi:hypothetical protein